MIKFLHPIYLWFWTLNALALAGLIYARIQRKKSLQLYAGSDLAPKMLDGYRPAWRRLKDHL